MRWYALSPCLSCHPSPCSSNPTGAAPKGAERKNTGIRRPSGSPPSGEHIAKGEGSNVPTFVDASPVGWRLAQYRSAVLSVLPSSTQKCSTVDSVQELPATAPGKTKQTHLWDDWLRLGSCLVLGRHFFLAEVCLVLERCAHVHLACFSIVSVYFCEVCATPKRKTHCLSLILALGSSRATFGSSQGPKLVMLNTAWHSNMF